MKLDKESMILYVITDRRWVGENTLEKQVEESLKGGATFIQLREKNLSFSEFLTQAKKIKVITDSYGVPFVINDNIEVAIKSKADGIHIGQDDMDAREVRKLIGKNKILGVSVSTVEEAKLAEKNGADYLGVGAVYKTGTKDDAELVSIDTIKKIYKEVSIPIVAIGGINENTILNLKDSGIDGVCCISAVFGKKDICKASRNLYNLAKQII